MMKLYFLFVLINLFVLLTIASNPPVDKCTHLSNGTCDICLEQKGCAYCKNKKLCFETEVSLTRPCDVSDLQEQTCFADAKTLIIILGCAGGVVLIAVIVIVWCVCRKCKNRSLQKDQRQQYSDNQRMEERRAAAEVRTAERGRAADQIKMKYGLLRDKESSSDYKRFS